METGSQATTPDTEDAVSLIAQVALEPSLDELGRRALALDNPSDADRLVMIEHFRRQRALWGAKGEAAGKEEE
jgi:hypothetical protein